jgi:hypothetical protein
MELIFEFAVRNRSLTAEISQQSILFPVENNPQMFFLLLAFLQIFICAAIQ